MGDTSIQIITLLGTLGLGGAVISALLSGSNNPTLIDGRRARITNREVHDTLHAATQETERILKKTSPITQSDVQRVKDAMRKAEDASERTNMDVQEKIRSLLAQQKVIINAEINQPNVDVKNRMEQFENIKRGVIDIESQFTPTAGITEQVPYMQFDQPPGPPFQPFQPFQSDTVQGQNDALMPTPAIQSGVNNASSSFQQLQDRYDASPPSTPLPTQDSTELQRAIAVARAIDSENCTEQINLLKNELAGKEEIISRLRTELNNIKSKFRELNGQLVQNPAGVQQSNVS